MMERIDATKEGRGSGMCPRGGREGVTGHVSTRYVILSTLVVGQHRLSRSAQSEHDNGLTHHSPVTVELGCS